MPDAFQLMTNLTAATMTGDAPYGLIEDAAIAVADRRIAWVGKRTDLPPELSALDAVDMGGRLVTPGLIDCHTHLVHGGNRAAEFEMRLNGASYEEVARAGGGIVSTVRATRAPASRSSPSGPTFDVEGDVDGDDEARRAECLAIRAQARACASASSRPSAIAASSRRAASRCRSGR